ncbi:tRNA 2-selenouridine(34) synthase MnmH [Synechococcus sp. CS-1325]|uniref:tRNA 2-selenouridine(34) synthase MnmH n=1 Tax=unclassified Synechococcus TaxID=2626047 RepID=UPI000DB880BE|nr:MULTISPECIES: tRNA 2-selenouridine(34) synthase MnmH [unclassified Synechococcus]PZU96624.1 MAG: tRNA 2-selenouridine(34) synthase MnmH [Cyanobium sp.]MCT0200887.1 tRNA 2-selenouridine(34) synthase MnmH [Synechococcus sp. CS-1325]MCT0213925.1 tRNA 2-selenouridine(34) synthase MnmH [Synechococcus sp. CS-1326]MCT0230827.1 tRNA 2-selenouridine(34) synthase MnmH [Synechococcus sp. CS-1324]MCT0233501.1 tRNA 2-selenouridine(34) synthase MnmH [Synechococcus sp. CS-1327]
MAVRLAIEPFLAAPGPLLDGRSPAEFERGHIPGAHSLPLFSDSERAEIGTLFKQQGRTAAVQLGLARVGPRLAELGEALRMRYEGQPLRIHCWRGGLRSASLGWLAETLDLPVLLLEGGYKAYRQWVLARFEQPWPLRLLAGRTGTGKTDLLLELARRGVAVVDLEGLAHHRGSSFGGLGQPPQPSTEHYENRLAHQLNQLAEAAEIWLEAESVQVGRCRIPAGLWRQMQTAPRLELRRPLEERVRRLVEVYGGQDGAALAEATARIAKRLGPERTKAALAAIAAGDWAEACRQMLDYYDRCYDHDARRAPAQQATLQLSGSSSPSLSPVAWIELGVWPEPTVAELLLNQGRISRAV